MGRTSNPRPLPELIAVLENSYRDYIMSSPQERATIDSKRLVPVLEMHDILQTYMLTGTFVDDPEEEIFIWAGYDPPRWPLVNGPGFH